MNNFNHIVINKNRGWRGLAGVVIRNESCDTQLQSIFSFSQPMWDDLINSHQVVVQDSKYYYVITFDDSDKKLPKPTQQRSVLIKNFIGKITNVNSYEKATWSSAGADDWMRITHFMKNRNNHTTSDWNCIGIRVTPMI